MQPSFRRRTANAPFVSPVRSAARASHARSFALLTTAPTGTWRWHLRPRLLHVAWACVASLFVLTAGAGANAPGDPAGGFGMHTVGGLEGRVIRVTSLEREGPGTLRAAIEAKGPRLVVFEVGGIIDQRIIDSVLKREGRIIDSQDEVGGYPSRESTRRELGTIPGGVEARRQWLDRMEREHS
jgi:hypothetical protein